MNQELYISKQKIFNKRRNTIAYELLFQDKLGEELELSSTVKEASKLVISSMGNTQLNKLLGKGTLAFLNVGEYILKT